MALKLTRVPVQMATQGAQRFELNRPPWALESQPTQLGFGMYW